MDMSYFPFDEQICSLKFGSWAHDSGDIDMFVRSNQGDTNNFNANGEFLLQGMLIYQGTSSIFI